MNLPKAEMNVVIEVDHVIEVIVVIAVIVENEVIGVVVKIRNDHEDLVAGHQVNIIPDHRNIDQVGAEVVIENDRLIVIHQGIDDVVAHLVHPKNYR